MLNLTGSQSRYVRALDTTKMDASYCPTVMNGCVRSCTAQPNIASNASHGTQSKFVQFMHRDIDSKISLDRKSAASSMKDVAIQAIVLRME